MEHVGSVCFYTFVVVLHIDSTLLLDFGGTGVGVEGLNEGDGPLAVGGERWLVATGDGAFLAGAGVAECEDSVALLRIDHVSGPLAILAQRRHAHRLPRVERVMVERLLGADAQAAAYGQGEEKKSIFHIFNYS